MFLCDKVGDLLRSSTYASYEARERHLPTYFLRYSPIRGFGQKPTKCTYLDTSLARIVRRSHLSAEFSITWGQQDPPRMKHGIRQSRTKANTYVPTYIVGENSPEKNPLSRNSQNFRPDEQHSKHEAAPDWHFFLALLVWQEVFLGYVKRPCMDTTELPVNCFDGIWVLKCKKKCPYGTRLFRYG